MRSRNCGTADSKESANLVVKGILVFWEKARIPTKHEADCRTKLLRLYGEWQTLRKHAKRSTDAHENAEKKFVDDLDSLFDVAHLDALRLIKYEEDKVFLQLQRQKGRPGCMAGVDTNLPLQEQSARKKKHNERANIQKIRKKVVRIFISIFNVGCSLFFHLILQLHQSI